jgi:hypothetical protein
MAAGGVAKRKCIDDVDTELADDLRALSGPVYAASHRLFRIAQPEPELHDRTVEHGNNEDRY